MCIWLVLWTHANTAKAHPIYPSNKVYMYGRTAGGIGRIFRGGCVQCIAVSVSMRSALGWSGGIKFEWSEVESDFPV